MDDNRMSISTEVYVQLDQRCSHFDGAPKGTQGIFRFVGRSTPVSNIMDHFHNSDFSVSGSKKWTFSGSNFNRTRSPILKFFSRSARA